jgi:uncharacterized protein
MLAWHAQLPSAESRAPRPLLRSGQATRAPAEWSQESRCVKLWTEVPLTSEERAGVRETVRLLRTALPVERIVLFGSKCRGDGDPESDIDILVLTRRPTSRAERHAACDLTYPVQLAHDVVISLLIVSVDEWRHGPISALPIRREIEEQGATVAA